MGLRRGLALLGALVLTVAVSGTAQAKPYEIVRDSGDYSFGENICGIDVEIAGSFSVVVINRPVPDSDGQAFFGHTTYEFSEVHTNTANDHQLLVRGKGVFHETSATHVEGDIWEFEALDAGTFTISTTDGERLLRDRGVVKFRALLDTLGDGQPGGELLEEEITAVHGPHADDSTFCGVYVAEMTG
jgi:hypothetical protein